MSFEAITTISDAENRARQIKADAQAAAAAAVQLMAEPLVALFTDSASGPGRGKGSDRGCRR